MATDAKSTLIAVDTNFLLDLAAHSPVCWDALETLKTRLPSPLILVPPTVINELAVAHDDPEDALEKELAILALKQLRRTWKFQPIEFVPAGHGIVERIADSIRERDYLPAEEKNDSYILAEAALLDCMLLVTADGHLLDVPANPLKLLLVGSRSFRFESVSVPSVPSVVKTPAPTEPALGDRGLPFPIRVRPRHPRRS